MTEIHSTLAMTLTFSRMIVTLLFTIFQARLRKTAAPPMAFLLQLQLRPTAHFCNPTQKPPRRYSDHRLLVVPLMPAIDALVKHAHRLVGGPDLHLHEVRLAVAALAADRRGLIDVLPRGGAAHNVVDGLPLRSEGVHVGTGDGPGVGTGRAEKDRAGGIGRGVGSRRSDLEEGAVEGAEPHGRMLSRLRRVLGCLNGKKRISRPLDDSACETV